jgi:hypothetical protein
MCVYMCVYVCVCVCTVGYATTNEWYNEQFLLIKSVYYNEHRCYNKCGGILLADVAHACTWHDGPSCFD